MSWEMRVVNVPTSTVTEVLVNNPRRSGIQLLGIDVAARYGPGEIGVGVNLGIEESGGSGGASPVLRGHIVGMSWSVFQASGADRLVFIMEELP